jgi:TolA-binding protein
VDPPAAARTEAASVTVTATSARWSRHDEGGLTLVRLEDGELEFQVAHGAKQHRLIVSLPDGELEDVGTAFHVAVAAGRTISVSVHEGAVVVHRAGRPAVYLVAGDRWFAEPAVPPAAASAPPKPPAALPSPPPPRSPPAAEATRHPARNAIAVEFRDAVALLDGGRNAAAAAALSAFLAHHGDDPRAEDASYLLVLALQRTGDTATTRAAARDYLQRYPSGFRRAQIEALAEPASTGPAR